MHRISSPARTVLRVRPLLIEMAISSESLAGSSGCSLMTEPDSQLAYLRSLPPGIRTNRALHDLLLRPRFLGYWTFLEPIYEGVELADVLMICGDTALLFEAKTRGLRRPASPAWLREKLREAVGQLNDRAGRLRAGGVTVRNSWRGEFVFDPEQIVHIYGVVVLVAEFEPFEWRDLVPDAAATTEIPVQVYSFFDLAELLRIFDTPNDLLVYYELRAQHGRSHRMLVGREIETFKDVLGTWDRLWQGNPQEAENTQHYFLDLANAVLRTSLAKEAGYEAWATSRLIDFAFRPSDQRADADPSGRRIGSPEHEIYVRALEAVGETSRLRRSYYGERWLKAADEAIAEGVPGVRKSHSPSRSRSYVLVATPLGEEPRGPLLQKLGIDAMLADGTESCLVLGASAASIRSSYDFLLKVIRGEEAEVPDEDACLAPTIAWLEPRQPDWSHRSR